MLYLGIVTVIIVLGSAYYVYYHNLDIERKMHGTHIDDGCHASSVRHDIEKMLQPSSGLAQGES